MLLRNWKKSPASFFQMLLRNWKKVFCEFFSDVPAELEKVSCEFFSDVPAELEKSLLRSFPRSVLARENRSLRNISEFYFFEWCEKNSGLKASADFCNLI